MTALGLDDELPRRRHDDDDDRRDGWPKPLVGVLGIVLMAVFGFIATDYATTKSEMVKQINNNSQRLAVLEEANRNVRESLARIENGIEEIRRRDADDPERRPRR